MIAADVFVKICCNVDAVEYINDCLSLLGWFCRRNEI